MLARRRRPSGSRHRAGRADLETCTGSATDRARSCVSPLTDREAFTRLVLALEPYLDVLVFAGGWAHRLLALHEFASPTDFEPLATDDADLAAPLLLEARTETLAERLRNAGFHEEFHGEDTP